MSLQKRGNIWHYSIPVEGQKPQRGTCGTGDRQVAERVEKEVKKKIRANFAYLVEGRVGMTTLAAMDIKRARKAQTRSNEKALKTGVIFHWKRICAFFEPELDNSCDPASLRKSDIEAYIDHRIQAGNVGQTYKRDVDTLRRALKNGSEKFGFALPIPKDAWPEIKMAPKNEARKGKLYSRETIHAWLDHLDAECRDQNILIAWTGLRKEECLRVCREMVQETGNPLSPARLVLPYWVCKTNVERTLGLVPPAWEALERQLARGVYRIISVKGQGDFHAVFSEKDYKNQMKTASKKIGLNRNLHQRSLRHSFLSDALWRSNDLKATMTYGGHSTVAAANMYQTSTLERETAVAMAVYKAFEKNRTQKRYTAR